MKNLQKVKSFHQLKSVVNETQVKRKKKFDWSKLVAKLYERNKQKRIENNPPLKKN